MKRNAVHCGLIGSLSFSRLIYYRMQFMFNVLKRKEENGEPKDAELKHNWFFFSPLFLFLIHKVDVLD